MKAVYIQQHGTIGDLKVSDIAAPLPNTGEVLVKVEAAGINPSDLVSARGGFPNAILPRIIGRDFAGTVAQGPPELIGGKVWGTGGDLGITRNGTHAEYLSLPRHAVARRPNNLSIEQAATVGVPFITAFSALVRLGRVQKGEWVIVSGAAGAVGQAASQLAHASGAHVIALVRQASDRQIPESAGVKVIAQSDQGNLEAVVREATGGKGADLALNGVGGSIFAPILASLTIGGRQVVYSTAGGKEFNLDIHAFYRGEFALFGLDTQKLDASQCAAILNELTPLFESGALKPSAIDERYPLAEAVQAYNRVAAGSGKVVLIMGQ